MTHLEEKCILEEECSTISRVRRFSNHVFVAQEMFIFFSTQQTSKGQLFLLLCVFMTLPNLIQQQQQSYPVHPNESKSY